MSFYGEIVSYIKGENRMIKRLIIINCIFIFCFAYHAFSNNNTYNKSQDILSIYPSSGVYIFEGNQVSQTNMMLGINGEYRYDKHWSNVFSIGYGEFECGKYYPLLSKSITEATNTYILQLNASYHFVSHKGYLTPFVSAGIGALIFDHNYISDKDQFLLNYGAGIDIHVLDNLFFRFDARHLFSFEDSNNNCNLTFALVYPWKFGKPGTDKLQMNPEKKLLKDIPSIQKLEAHTVTPILDEEINKDPEPQKLDDDHDGVNNAFDKCPTTPAKIEVDNTGCPIDTDFDGIPDFQDKCNESIVNQRFVDEFGCPKDTDNDGVYDHHDKCPQTVSGYNVDMYGCAEDLDNDSVPDDKDKCINTPEIIKTDSNGCPLSLKQQEIEPLTIFYSSESSEVALKYYEEMKRISVILNYFKYSYVLIEGYTDNTGSQKYNLDLSEKRGYEVKKFFIDAFSVNPVQLEVVPKGEANPVSDNSSEAGRRENRRVVITIYSNDSFKQFD